MKQDKFFAGDVVPPKMIWKKVSGRFVKVAEPTPCGVCWCPSKNAWTAHVGGKLQPYKKKHFRTMQEAVAQRDLWMNEYRETLAAQVPASPSPPLASV